MNALKEPLVFTMFHVICSVGFIAGLWHVGGNLYDQGDFKAQMLDFQVNMQKMNGPQQDPYEQARIRTALSAANADKSFGSILLAMSALPILTMTLGITQAIRYYRLSSSKNAAPPS